MDNKVDDAPEEEGTQDVILSIASQVFLLALPEAEVPASMRSETKESLLSTIRELAMAPYYRHVCSTLDWKVDEELVASLEEANAKELKDLEAKQADAKENQGDVEVRDVMLARANFYARIGDKAKALAAYTELLEQAVGAGGRIDMVFSIIRMGLVWDDKKLVKQYVETCHKMVEDGGDWERRNRLGVYEALYRITNRQFKQAAELLLKAVATFTCNELFDYNTLVFYTVLCSMVALDRVTIRDKVARSPDVLAVVDDIPNLRTFIFSLYQCQYNQFFQAMVDIGPQIRRDRYLSGHLGFIIRQLRIVVYSQFLTSYQTVTMASMASAFGVSCDFLDRELSRFIASGHLTCKIDKVGGIIETIRPDAKNAQYKEFIKHGDLLLNQIQKLSKIIHF